MKNILLYNDFIKMLFIICIIYFICNKITNNNENSVYKNLFVILIGIIISSFYLILIKYFNSICVFTILILLYSIIVNVIMKDKYNFIVFLISFAITYIIYLISIIFSGLILKILIPKINYTNPISIFTIPIIGTLISYLLFKNRRIKHGFNFLKQTKYNKNIVIAILFFTEASAILFILFQNNNTNKINTILFINILFVVATLIIWTQNQITKQYKRNMRDRTIEIQTKEIVEQSKIIKEIKEENLKLAETIHKYNNRLSVLELGIANALKNNNKTEFANELGLMLEETKELSKNFAEETTINKTNLPKTNIIGLDNMFKYFQNEANKNNIDFNVIINENIEDLLKIIDKPKLETLIGDHLKDAIIAVKESENSYKSILAILGVSEDCYEFSICDSGIEFEIDTLLKLGLEQTTTHKDSGGSGIGFMTTFETLKETKASLIIEEYNPKTTNYTKSVIIRFDGKNEYRIYSYRAEEIKKKNNEKRIIIEEL